ncbi:MAG: TldD/PmbA family protein [Candidatus Nitrosotenuis sp.]
MTVCSDIVSYARNLLIDECEAVLCTKKILTVRITDSEIAEIKENFEKSLGIRMIHDKKILSLESTLLEPKKIVDKALKSTKNLTKREFWKSLPFNKKTPIVEKTNDQKVWEIDSTKASEIANQMIDAASHKLVSRISGSLNVVCDYFELENSNGLQRSERATYLSAVINADSESGSSPVSGIGQANSRTLEDFDATSVGREAMQMCVSSLNPRSCDVGITSIVFEPIAIGEILTFVIGPNFNLKTFSEKRSCFSDKHGVKIAVDEFSLIDDPHLPNGLGTKSFDDEGTPTKKTSFIDNGIFVGTYSDSYNAFKENVESSANACRPGSPLGRASNPIPVAAPHNLTIKPGKVSHEEVISDTKNGILISRLWYTYAVNPIKGDFSCTARSGIWMIQNGELKSPAKPIRIIHNLPVLLQNISQIANNSRTVLPWAAMPVTASTIRCDKISVSPI